MTFCMVGAGKVASQLAPALKEAGYKPLGVYSRSMEHAASLASRIGTTGVDRITALPAGADAYLIAVKDDAIADVAAELAPHVAPGGGRAVMVHTSGSTPLSVLSTTGARCGVMYPLYSFTADYRQDVGDVPFFIEASDADVQRLLLAVAGSISRRPVTVMDSATRRRMHLAAVFASNFPNRCYAIAEKIMRSSGVPFDLMLPLIMNTARKVERISPLEAQTGPAVRYDRKVIAAHEQMLSGDDLDVYETLTRSIHDAAVENENISEHNDKLRPNENQGDSL